MPGVEQAAAHRNGVKLEEVRRSADSVHEKGFNFDDTRLMCGAWRDARDTDICKVDLILDR